MAELVTLAEDGPLGKKGDQVWVDEPQEKSTKQPAKKSASKKKSK